MKNFNMLMFIKKSLIANICQYDVEFLSMSPLQFPISRKMSLPKCPSRTNKLLLS